jgi:hypothetical protein
VDAATPRGATATAARGGASASAGIVRALARACEENAAAMRPRRATARMQLLRASSYPQHQKQGLGPKSPSVS